MTAAPMFHGFDGLMNLSRREGVDIRPTLLRVLTDLYVQTSTHNLDEERQFVELTSRLIDDVDDATRAAVRARLATYPNTPREIRRKLGIAPPPFPRRAQAAPPLQPHLDDEVTFADESDDIEIVDAPPVIPQAAPAPRPLPTLSMQPADASSLNDMFLAAGPKGRAEILDNLNDAPLTPSVRVDPRRAARALVNLEQAAMVADIPAFTSELGDALILPASTAAQIVSDPQGEPLACAARALGMPGEIFQRVLLFLNPSIGSSVMDVYRLARMYDNLSERSALIMLAAWRGSSIAHARAKYRPALYDDERHRARVAPAQIRPASQPGSTQHGTPRVPLRGSSGRQG
ncbi:MAG: DUF2336 domain-containing protein [Xanthobacteraceae bacterium]|nr:DUF2336 domain-containing protein [Xanthobacteraceae bacterium]